MESIVFKVNELKNRNLYNDNVKTIHWTFYKNNKYKNI